MHLGTRPHHSQNIDGIGAYMTYYHVAMLDLYTFTFFSADTGYSKQYLQLYAYQQSRV
jgi:hypothetical protein